MHWHALNLLKKKNSEIIKEQLKKSKFDIDLSLSDEIIF